MCLGHNEILYLVHVWFIDILIPQLLVGGFISVLFIEVIHLWICFWDISDQMSDGRNLWVGEGVCGFSHDVWVASVTVCWSEVLLHLLHCLGKFFECSWPKVKNVAFRVSAPALEVSLGFGLQAWIIYRFLDSVLLCIIGFPLVPVIWYIKFINLMWEGWFYSSIPPPFPLYFLFFCCSHICVWNE